jgi:hypothetical protein
MSAILEVADFPAIVNEPVASAILEFANSAATMIGRAVNTILEFADFPATVNVIDVSHGAAAAVWQWNDNDQ